MSAVRGGYSLARQGRKITEQMRDGIITGRPNDVGVQGGAQAAQLPARFTAYQTRDDIIQLKQQMMNDDGWSPFGRVVASDADFKWLQNKEAAAEAVNFDAWFNEGFNKNDLASRQFAQDVNPEFYERREREMMEKMDMIKRIRFLQLRGPQDEEDLRLLYLLNSGRVQLPADWDRVGADWSAGSADPTEANQQQFVGGLIRMPLFLNSEQRLNTVQHEARISAPFVADNSLTAAAGNFYSFQPPGNNAKMATPAGGQTFSDSVMSTLGYRQ